MSKSLKLLRVTVFVGIYFHCFLRGAISWESTARQADQGLKHERFKVKCSLVSLKFNGNLPSASISCADMSKIQMQKGKARFTRIGYIFEPELNVTHVLENDFSKFSCVSN